MPECILYFYFCSWLQCTSICARGYYSERVPCTQPYEPIWSSEDYRASPEADCQQETTERWLCSVPSSPLTTQLSILSSSSIVLFSTLSNSNSLSLSLFHSLSLSLALSLIHNHPVCALAMPTTNANRRPAMAPAARFVAKRVVTAAYNKTQPHFQSQAQYDAAFRRQVQQNMKQCGKPTWCGK